LYRPPPKRHVMPLACRPATAAAAAAGSPAGPRRQGAHTRRRGQRPRIWGGCSIVGRQKPLVRPVERGRDIERAYPTRPPRVRLRFRVRGVDLAVVGWWVPISQVMSLLGLDKTKKTCVRPPYRCGRQGFSKGEGGRQRGGGVLPTRVQSRSQPCTSLVCGPGGFQHFLGLHERVVVQFFERAPTSVSGGHGVRLQPRRVDVLVKIVLRARRRLAVVSPAHRMKACVRRACVKKVRRPVARVARFLSLSLCEFRLLQT
jgi:hypothetical protein